MLAPVALDVGDGRGRVGGADEYLVARRVAGKPEHLGRRIGHQDPDMLPILANQTRLNLFHCCTGQRGSLVLAQCFRRLNLQAAAGRPYCGEHANGRHEDDNDRHDHGALPLEHLAFEHLLEPDGTHDAE
jgi:hypothetical protein